MLDHYSHIRLGAKRKALDALSQGGHVTNRVTNVVGENLPSQQVVDNAGMGDGTRTRERITV
jgi:hypothetical protein